VPYALGARLLASWWSLWPVQAWALRKLRRKYPDHPFYQQRQDRLSLRRHLNCAFFRYWREAAVDRCSDRTLRRWVHFEGVEHLEKARSTGRGVILAGSHYGAAGTLKILLARFGLDLLSIGVARGGRPRGPWRHGRTFWLTDRSNEALLLRALVEARRVLRHGGGVHLAADSPIGRSGVEVAFLGRPRRFPTGFASLSCTTGAPVVPVFALLAADGRISVEFRPALTPADPGRPRAERLEMLVRQYAECLERQWQADPALVFSGGPVDLRGRDWQSLKRAAARPR